MIFECIYIINLGKINKEENLIKKGKESQGGIYK